jgi:hypothetical protein
MAYILNLHDTYLVPLSQIISHSMNLGESKHFKFDQIYIIK